MICRVVSVLILIMSGYARGELSAGSYKPPRPSLQITQDVINSMPLLEAKESVFQALIQFISDYEGMAMAQLKRPLESSPIKKQQTQAYIRNIVDGVKSKEQLQVGLILDRASAELDQIFKEFIRKETLASGGQEVAPKSNRVVVQSSSSDKMVQLLEYKVDSLGLKVDRLIGEATNQIKQASDFSHSAAMGLEQRFGVLESRMTKIEAQINGISQGKMEAFFSFERLKRFDFVLLFGLQVLLCVFLFVRES